MFQWLKNLFLKLKSNYLTRNAKFELEAWKEEFNLYNLRCCHCGKIITHNEYKQAPTLIWVIEDRPECLSCIAKILSGKLYKQ